MPRVEQFYFVCEVICAEARQAAGLTAAALQQALSEQLVLVHGLYGASVGAEVAQYAAPLLLVSCGRRHEAMVRNALTLLGAVGDVRCLCVTRLASASSEACRRLLAQHTAPVGAASGSASAPPRKGAWWDCFADGAAPAAAGP